MTPEHKLTSTFVPTATAIESTPDTRQLLLPITTIEFAYHYRGLSSTRRWEIDHRSTGSIDEAEDNGRQESTGSRGGIRYEREVGAELAQGIVAVGEEEGQTKAEDVTGPVSGSGGGGYRAVAAVGHRWSAGDTDIASHSMRIGETANHVGFGCVVIVSTGAQFHHDEGTGLRYGNGSLKDDLDRRCMQALAHRCHARKYLLLLQSRQATERCTASLTPSVSGLLLSQSPPAFLILRCIMQYVENHRAHWSEYAENRVRNSLRFLYHRLRA